MDALVVHGDAIFVGALLGGACAGALIGAVMARAARWRRWMTRIQHLGAGGRAELAHGSTGWLEGTLTGAEHEDAIVTLAIGVQRGADAISESTHPAGLAITIGNRRIPILGPIEIVSAARMGPRLDPAARERMANAMHIDVDVGRKMRGETRRVASGVTVRVAGRLRRSTSGEGAGYRTAADALVLEGVRGPVLVYRAGVRGGVAARSLVGAAVAAVLVIGAAFASPAVALVSPLHRPDAVAGLGPAQRLLLLDDDHHAARARALRELGRRHEALDEARRGSDPRSLSLAFELRHEGDDLAGDDLEGDASSSAYDAWPRIANALEAQCNKGGACVAREDAYRLAHTPLRFGRSDDDAVLRDVLYSRVEDEIAIPAIRHGRASWARRPKGPLDAELTIAWTLELAALMIDLGERESSERALQRAEALREDAQLSEPIRRALMRDTDALRIVRAMRDGRMTEAELEEAARAQRGALRDELTMRAWMARGRYWPEITNRYPGRTSLLIETAIRHGTLTDTDVAWPPGAPAELFELVRLVAGFLGEATHSELTNGRSTVARCAGRSPRLMVHEHAYARMLAALVYSERDGFDAWEPVGAARCRGRLRGPWTEGEARVVVPYGTAFDASEEGASLRAALAVARFLAQP
ncbi:MAG: hypothetical protein AB7S26_37595 [Sandaracinaceae bacterium]